MTPRNLKKTIATAGAAEGIGPFTFTQAKGQRLTYDSVLLAGFLPPLGKNDAVVDLGTGSGVIPLILCSRSGAGRIVGVEVDGESAEIAGKNVRRNGLRARVEIINRDWRELKDVYPPGSFSVVVSNPPYMKRGEGRVSPARQRALARYETAGTLSDLVEISVYLAGASGRIFYVYPARRFEELILELEKRGIKPLRVAFARTGGKNPKIFLIEAGKGAFN
ncbi:MAG: methyltransferase [Deltaproteobacteria bacterium]|nr:methyltransferase [Deltaproteobacteria bacterium]